MYQSLANSYALVDDHESSVSYFKRYNSIHDKIDDKSIISEYLLKEAKDQLEKAQLEQSLTNEKIKSEKQQKYIWILLAITVIITGAFFFYKNTENKKHAKAIAEKNELLELQNKKLEKNSEILALN